MESPTVPAAPAQPTTAPVISATRDAANRGDFSAFDKAHTSARQGNPLPDVKVESTPEKPVAAAPAPAAEPPERKVSNRQQQINDYERRIAEQNERIARLEAAQRQPPAAPRSEQPPPTAQPETKVAEWKRLAALPEAPKLADFDSVEEHTAAMALFIADKRHEERVTADRHRQSVDAERADMDTRVQSYGERMQRAAQADPDLKSKIAPEILNTHPISGYPTDPRTGQRIDPATGQPLRVTFAHAVAEVGFRYAENPAALYAHLTAHVDERNRIAAMPFPDAMAALIALSGRVAGTPTSAGTPEPAKPAPSTITAAPAPPETLSKAGGAADPKQAALARGDFATFDKLEMQERIARRKGAA